MQSKKLIEPQSRQNDCSFYKTCGSLRQQKIECSPLGLWSMLLPRTPFTHSLLQHLAFPQLWHTHPPLADTQSDTHQFGSADEACSHHTFGGCQWYLKCAAIFVLLSVLPSVAVRCWETVIVRVTSWLYGNFSKFYCLLASLIADTITDVIYHLHCWCHF